MRRPALSAKVVIGIEKLLGRIVMSELLDTYLLEEERDYIDKAIDYLEKLTDWKKEHP